MSQEEIINLNEQEEIVVSDEEACEEEVEVLGEDGEMGICLDNCAEADEKLWKETHSSCDEDYVYDATDAPPVSEEECDEECLAHDVCILQAIKVDEFILGQGWEFYTEPQVRRSALCELICDHYRSAE